jgi:hypothetical protein
MDFNSAAKLGSLITKDYAEEFFKLLIKYKDISASEAASRLNQHIKTAQDFLDGLSASDILEKTEVYEGKRPYYRYKLKKKKFSITVDLDQFEIEDPSSSIRNKKIRERKNSGAIFTASGSKPMLSSITFGVGNGRSTKERKISLTTTQGKFLYFLPFPNAEFKNISLIMKEANIDSSYQEEIADIISILKTNNIIEMK